jgi:hypothetical protein
LVRHRFSSQAEVNYPQSLSGARKKKNVVHYRRRQIVLQDSRSTSQLTTTPEATAQRRRFWMAGHPAEFDAPLLSVTSLRHCLSISTEEFDDFNSISTVEFDGFNSIFSFSL